MLTHDEHVQWARSMMTKILYLTIASTSVDSLPWNTPVYSSFDNAGHFYWTSAPESRHSTNIRDNPNVALVIYDSTVPRGAASAAVYIEATAHVLEDIEDIRRARATLTARFSNPTFDQDPTTYLAGGARRVYTAVPTRAWVNIDELDRDGNWLRDARAEIPLSALSNLATWL